MSTLDSPAVVSSLLEGVRQIEPLLRAHVTGAEQERRLPDEVAGAMRELGLYRLWRPRALGGLEVDPMSAFRVFEEVSRLNSAAGWNLQLSCGLDPFGAWFCDDGAREIFGGPDGILAGAYFPFRRAVPVEGGYLVSGRTPFVSGAHQCGWVFGLANVFDDAGGPRLDEHGMPVTLLTACPAREAVILDTWRTLGMRGTGSHDVMMQDVFVPARHAAFLVPLATPGPAYTGPLYRFTIWASISALSSVATGIARAALDDLLELVGRKTPSYVARPLRDRDVVQGTIGRAEATLGAARAYLYEALQEVWSGALDGRTIDMPGKIKLQLAATQAAVSAAQVVDLVHAVAGTSGIRDEQPFQRHFRDVHTITQHGYISASRYESVGQLRVGAPVEWPFYPL